MKEENKYSRLLSINQLKSLYHDIESVYRTEIDIRNSGYDLIALDNSISLLLEIDFIVYQDECYRKTNGIADDLFEKELIVALEERLSVVIEEMFSCEKHFDNSNNSFFIYRNEIKSRFLGLLMLFGDLNVVILDGSKVYFKENSSISKRALKKKITKEQLDKILKHEEEIGEEAEQKVIEYETKKLIKLGISRTPIQVSQIDVSAGFDILSYFSASENDNKYIEVKSCDNSMEFYISSNEVDTARLYGDRYYLYLYNRIKKEILEIQNPWENIFNSDNGNWSIVPQSYKLKRKRPYDE